MVGSASTEAVVLICTNSDLDRLEPAEATEVIQSATADMGARGSTLGAYSSRARAETVTYDRVPAGEVQMRRGEKVHAADGDIGRLQGLVVDGSNHIRVYCPRLQVSSKKGRTIAAGKEISYGVTLTALPDATGTAVHEFYVVAALAS